MRGGTRTGFPVALFPVVADALNSVLLAEGSMSDPSQNWWLLSAEISGVDDLVLEFCEIGNCGQTAMFSPAVAVLGSIIEDGIS